MRSAKKRQSPRERRCAPRAEAKIPVRIGRARGIVSGRTTNISSTGAYCLSEKFIPINTELDVSLLVPARARGRRKAVRKVACRGIVVRNQPEGTRPREHLYGLAIHFTDIARGGRRDLDEYVRAHLDPGERREFEGRGKRARAYEPGEVYSTGAAGRGAFRINSSNFRVFGDDLSLSKNGLCCKTDRDIPLFREIAVNLLLPPPRGEREAEALQCSAVVVGCARIPKSGRYNLAAYFIGLSREQKARLDDCLRGIV
ncbi:MAG: PilZ domain-containing protein [bacterium]|nr:PilZ domain-containing protein [bacterium]